MTKKVSTHEWSQEWFDTGNPDIRRRAAALRRLGFKVTVCNMGRQVTDVGSINMTMIDVRRNGVDECVWDTVIA